MKTAIRVEISLDGDGYTVIAGDSRWRFNRQGYASIFRHRMEFDELFREQIIDHALTHNWEKCLTVRCIGARWQEIQAL